MRYSSLHVISCIRHPRGATSSSFRGGQFSWTFIQWRHGAYSTVAQLFRKWSQICSLRNISEN